VTDGLYRTDNDKSTTIMKCGWSKDTKGCPWLVRFTNVFGSRVEKRFSSLKTVRHYLNTGETEF
jgi:hypothetical protein